MSNQFSLLISFAFCVTCVNVVFKHSSGVMAMPLYTQSRWIVDDNGKRVKLACVNWPSHLQPLLAEGLNKQPLDAISKRVRTMGFNCVRLTWPIYLVTNDSLASVTVQKSFEGLGLAESIAGIQANNPSFLDLSLMKAFQAVVSNLGNNNVMVILDNHLTVPGWCCGRTDGNGFFGDQYFDSNLWVDGLSQMATIFKGTKNVVGMSLRNELRGPSQNINLWYRYMQQGAEAVHAANPDVLVILSGLEFATDLSFLRSTPMELSFTRKLVFEMHWYSFTAGNAWSKGNANQVCGSVVNGIMGRTGFLVQQGWPLFLSEFGADLRGTNMYDSRYLSCMFGVVADLDLEWALWSLQGSYYLREGVKDLEEVYGVLNSNWSGVRNPAFMEKISFIQHPFQGPGLSNAPYNIIYHPSSGHCILKNPLRLGSCSESDTWTYTPQKTMTSKDSNLCLQAAGLEKSPIFGNACSQWEMISDSKMHLSSKLADGTTVCLDTDNNGNIVTNPCKCLTGDPACDPISQWFKIVTSARSTGSN